MEKLSKDQVLKELSSILYPGFSRDIVSFGLIKDIFIDGNFVTINISLTTNKKEVATEIEDKIKNLLQKNKLIAEFKINFNLETPVSSNPTDNRTKIPGVKNVIAISSGKGGVGKSTISSNLALAMSMLGAKVGLCDCDLYGPSIPLMMSQQKQENIQPLVNENNQIIPISKHGIKLMSMGYLLTDDSPVIIRGPLATRYTQQFLSQVDWSQGGELDCLILDLPPGTGDIQLTIVQTVALSGAIIVTTPQEIALIDARKAISMFQKVNVNILGIIENMSYFLSPSDNKKYYIFGKDGGKNEAKKLNTKLLGTVPIDLAAREAGDSGTPVVGIDNNSTKNIRKNFLTIAKNCINELKITL